MSFTSDCLDFFTLDKISYTCHFCKKCQRCLDCSSS